jgi:hypothetical protein
MSSRNLHRLVFLAVGILGSMAPSADADETIETLFLMAVESSGGEYVAAVDGISARQARS